MLTTSISPLAHRATLGFSEAVASEIDAAGPRSWLKRQLAPESDEDRALSQRLSARYPTLSMSGQELRDQYAYSAPTVGHELRASWLDRALFSNRQLFERVVWFWTDHFNVPLATEHGTFLKAVDDRDVVRRHAMGRFYDLLSSSAHSGAMLASLDNDTNVAGSPNENYARELMELHTLGIDGPYTETDVREVARCFTGWTFVGPNDPVRDYGAFRFDHSVHDDGAKQVLGHALPAGGGHQDGVRVLQILAAHPSTARHVARKLLRWFVTYDPTEANVERVANIYLKTGGNIAAMLLFILDPPMELGLTPKLKQPFHYAVSLLRALDLDVQDSLQAIWSLESMRQLPFGWPAPDGYPDTIEAWSGSMLTRWHFSSQVCNGWWSFGAVANLDLQQRMQGAPRSQWGQRISEVLTGGAMSAQEILAIQAFLDGIQWPGPNDLGQAFELAASGPTFQQF